MQEQVPGWSVLLMNYRGYGLSQGAPGQDELYRDALFLYDHFTARAEIDKQRVVLMGRSLGSGVATYVASQRRVAGVILTTPYDSIAAVAQNFYPYVPVRLLLRHPFDALSLAGEIRVPLLALVAERDQVIPPIHAERLIAAWAGPKQRVVIPGADHDSLVGENLYWDSVRAFLQGI
jgi:pimeloyl-ACP methyl ester carboxylesterase